MSNSGLFLRTERTDSASVLHVIGELDLSTIATFDAELEQLLGEDLVVVLTECTFIDSSALRSLVHAQRTARDGGKDLALVAPSQPARRVLEVATLDRHMRVYENLDDAVLSLT
jgi:anti-anti-sigma factor